MAYVTLAAPKSTMWTDSVDDMGRELAVLDSKNWVIEAVTRGPFYDFWIQIT